MLDLCEAPLRLVHGPHHCTWPISNVPYNT